MLQEERMDYGTPGGQRPMERPCMESDRQTGRLTGSRLSSIFSKAQREDEESAQPASET